MIGLRHVLAPAPAWLTPSRVAVATVAAVTAAAAPSVAGIPDITREMRGSSAALLVVMTVTATFAAVLARKALRAPTPLGVHLRLCLGGAVAGTLATAVSFLGVRLLHHGTAVVSESLADQLVLGSPMLGGTLGFLFGTAYAPVVTTAMRARENPSHDGLDRVAFAAGASLLAAAALRALCGSPPVGAWIGVAAGVVGGVMCVFAAARIMVRVRLLARVREGSIAGFHVVPRSGREDEAPLVPLVRSATPPAGVLAATGISAPYRGARGVFKLALAPLPDEPAGRPIATLLWAALAPLSHAVVTLMLGAVAVAVLSPVLMVLVVARW